MILNTRNSFSLCALLAILTPAVIEAVPEKEKKPAKIEGTANPEKFPPPKIPTKLFSPPSPAKRRLPYLTSDSLTGGSRQVSEELPLKT